LKNRELADIFERIADALTIRGEVGFRVLAYQKASRVLRDLTEDIKDLEAEGRLDEVEGLGSGLVKKAREFLATGKVAKLDEVTAGLPPGLFEILKVHGVGPKTVKLAFEQLGVTDLAGLKQAIDSGKLSGLPGMGDKRSANILQGIRAGEHAGERMYLDEAIELCDTVIGYMRNAPGVSGLSPAGSLRRGAETVGDIDVLVCGRSGPAIIGYFTGHPRIRQVLSAGDTKASVLMQSRGGNRQVDLRVLRPAEFGAALQYFTGSKDHNVALRGLAQKRGLKLSEYGLFRGERRIAGRTEEQVYRALGLSYIEPELRENRGELDAAAGAGLPELVRLTDIRGDLHMHTSMSDGTATLADMMAACRKRGYSYMAAADHSVSAGYAGGLSPDALERHCDAVDLLNEKLKGLRVLKASEVDITPSGALDYPDRILQRLDYVTGSIHQGFRKDVTRRICGALAHPLLHAVSHPTGRIIGHRPGYEVDTDQVIHCAAQHHKLLEINAFYGRLDLSDIWARRAAQSGVMLVINTDAHSVADLGWMRYGVLTARRAWLTKADIINTLPLQRLLRALKQIREGRKVG
jgi:DNA polymerase (family X)